MDEYANMDVLKSLARAIELLAEENKELRKEIKEFRNNYGYCTQLTDKETEIYNSKIESESKLTGVKIK